MCFLQLSERMGINTEGKELGQTLIETVFVLVLLLLLIFGIAEFARAWYVKNSLNNGARVGARVGAVAPDVDLLAEVAASPISCDPAPPSTQEVAYAVCVNSPGVPGDAEVTVAFTITDGDDTGVLDAGDTVTVRVSADFSSVTSLIDVITGTTTLSSQASMRYEL